MLKFKKWMRPIMHAFDGLTQKQVDEIAERVDNYASHSQWFMFFAGWVAGWIFALIGGWIGSF